jgi:hypothetical protein
MASSIEITSAHETLLGVIRRVRARWRLKLALRGAAIVLGALVVALLVGAYVMQTARFAPGAITGVRIGAYVLLAVLIGQYLVRPCCDARVTSTWPSIWRSTSPHSTPPC